MKFYDGDYVMKKKDHDDLERRVRSFRTANGIRQAIHPVLVTTYGLANNQYSSIFQLLLTYYVPAGRDKQYFIRAVDIQQELACHVRASDVPNIKQLTIALKAQHFHHGRMDGQRGWYARHRE